MEFSKKVIYKGVKKSWKDIIKESMKNDNYKKIKEKILSTKNIIYPNYDNIFETFKYFDLEDTKVVIIGQDCYINHIIKDTIVIPQANGMCFSVSSEHKTPPSLKNIFKELDETIDEFTIPTSGDLSRWVKEEKVLLLNAALTVEAGKSNSHANLWTPVTNNIIKEISNQTENIVFILWGNFAKTKAEFIDQSKHKVISGVHPSPLAARYNMKGTQKSFFGHAYFNKANEYLIKHNKEPISWLL